MAAEEISILILFPNINIYIYIYICIDSWQHSILEQINEVDIQSKYLINSTAAKLNFVGQPCIGGPTMVWALLLF